MSENVQSSESKSKSAINILEFREGLAGSIQGLEARLQQDRVSLSKIDEALRVIDPSIDIAGSKVRQPQRKRRTAGATVFVLSVLRDADQAQTTRDLGVKLAASRGLHGAEEIEKAVQQVGNTLQALRRQGTVESVKASIGPQAWRVTD